jgi:hypothetical protein
VKDLLYFQIDKDTDLSKLLAKGADEEFDRCLRSLAEVAKKCPKLIIDSIMYWRKSKREDSTGGLN